MTAKQAILSALHDVEMGQTIRAARLAGEIDDVGHAGIIKAAAKDALHNLAVVAFLQTLVKTLDDENAEIMCTALAAFDAIAPYIKHNHKAKMASATRTALDVETCEECTKKALMTSQETEPLGAAVLRDYLTRKG